MTVIRPNSVAGINSITVQSGNSLAVHKANGELIRTITANSGVSTFSSISVGTATTDNSAAKSINIGVGASIAQHNDNALTFGTNGDPRITIDASGNFNVGSAATIKAGGNATFSGIVTATSFVGGLPITSGADNRIITASSASAIQGESNLTFDGGALSQTIDANDEGINITSSGAHSARLKVDTNQSSADDTIFFQSARWNSTEVASIHFRAGADTTNKDDGRLTFHTRPSGSSMAERLRIDESGRIGIQGAATRALLDVRASGGSNTMLTAVFGANEGQTGGSLSDNADKAARVGSYHYDIDEEPFGIFVASGSNGTNNLTLGGGTSLMNAATAVSIYTAANSTTTNGTKRLEIDSNGDLGLGISAVPQDSGARTLHIHSTTSGGSARAAIRLTHADSGSSASNGAFIGFDANPDFYIFNQESGNIRFGVNGTDEFKISSTNGRLERSFGGGSGSGSDLDGMWFNNDQAATGTFVRFWQTSGGYGANQIGSISHTANNTAYNTSSDYRLKENINAITDAITRLKTLKPSRFNFKTEPSVTVDGFIAHEVTAVPEAVTGTKDEVDSNGDPLYQGIDQSKLVPLLTAALQEAVTKIETLETKVAALEGG